MLQHRQPTIVATNSQCSWKRGGKAINKKGKTTTVQREEQSTTNDGIRYAKVRLIGSDGSQLGIFTAEEARQMAYEEGLDLVEMSANADPPVCRIMNYDKFRYEQKKKQQEAKKKQTVIETKEIKFRPKTEEHDLAFKIAHIKKFLSQKNKVKLTMRFRGREIVYAQTIGLEAMNKIMETLEEDALILQPPKREGRQLVMFVGPK